MTAEELLERVRSGEAKPTDITNALKLLEKNGVGIDVDSGDPIEILANTLGEEGEDLPFLSQQ